MDSRIMLTFVVALGVVACGVTDTIVSSEIVQSVPLVEVQDIASIFTQPESQEPEKDCAPVKKSKLRIRDEDTPTLVCRGGREGIEKCESVCSKAGFRKGECMSDSRKPVETTCVCTNNGKIGLIAKESQGRKQLRSMKGYYGGWFPYAGACDRCTCELECYEEDNSALFTGRCIEKSCYCLYSGYSNSWYDEYKQKKSQRTASIIGKPL